MAQNLGTLHDDKYYLEPQLTEDRLQALKDGGVKSILYLCKGEEGDSGFAEGTEVLKSHFAEGHVKHVPLEVTKAEYQVSSDGLEVPWQRVLAYKRFEHALQVLPGPCAIVCKSARRAAAVYSAYKGVTQGLSNEVVLDYISKNALKCSDAEGLLTWVKSVNNELGKLHSLFFRQLYEASSSTYTYLLADTITKEAILIDPVLETVERDYNLIKELGFTLKYAINTHCHADHVTGTGKLKQLSPTTKSAIAQASGAKADIYLNEFDVLQFGNRKLYSLSTPGHTDGCISYVLDDLTMVFTGDTLLIRGCGRTDFQSGSASGLYSSIHNKLYKYLLPETTVYPAHDYKGQTASTIGEEMAFNPRLTKPLEEFVNIMNNLNLPKPKKIDEAVPANLVCGVHDL